MMIETVVPTWTHSNQRFFGSTALLALIGVLRKTRLGILRRGRVQRRAPTAYSRNRSRTWSHLGAVSCGEMN
jgi:hypothetical protein